MIKVVLESRSSVCLSEQICPFPSSCLLDVMELMFAEWEDGERFSFEDSDRFEEDSLCSFISEAESLCQNWRGWRKQSAGPNSPTVKMKGESTVSLGCSGNLSETSGPCADGEACIHVGTIQGMSQNQLPSRGSF